MRKIDDVIDINISVVPNPLTLGATAFVYGDFGEIETVEVLNQLGQLVESFTPQTYPIELSGFTAAGLYHIRLTASDGRVYMRKLIVR